VRDFELVGRDPLHGLQWRDEPGCTVQREVAAGEWVNVATYSEPLPVGARPFTRWLAANAGLTFDMAEDAVDWLRENVPARFIDPFDESD
jgi:hypothetical protein